MAQTMVLRRRPGAALLMLSTLGSFTVWLSSAPPSFTRVQCQTPRGSAVQLPPVLARRVSSTIPEAASTKKEKSQKEIDDAVLEMAMAMAEEEQEGSPKGTMPKKSEEGFDLNVIVTLFLVVIIIYSFGSAFIGIATGRVQDRTGGDFTPYDFLDNIIAFKEWNLEYTLGFDPFKMLSKS
mmetsp:Transcript_140008/g.390279  ORF Transcript_140008/g.390279 Transcript_140008/m.390279 type:complete len:180 (+) Transcript_140008:41-580(+)